MIENSNFGLTGEMTESDNLPSESWGKHDQRKSYRIAE
jgi:hypothetical protein